MGQEGKNMSGALVRSVGGARISGKLWNGCNFNISLPYLDGQNLIDYNSRYPECRALLRNADNGTLAVRLHTKDGKKLDYPPQILEPVWRMEDLDKIWADVGIQQHDGKAVYDGVLDGTALGIDQCRGTHLGPSACKLFLLLCGAADLFENPWATLLELSSFCGILQWFNLLNRWLLSCFHHVYAFNRRAAARDLQVVPVHVLGEVMLKSLRR